MKYAKSRPTQSEFVAAWWDEQERKTDQKLEEHYPGIASVKLFSGMAYSEKIRFIPNNALRRAGLKPRRRNGKRKKEQTVLSQATLQRILRGIDKAVTQIAALEMEKMTEKFADVGKMDVVFTDSQDRLEAARRYFMSDASNRPYSGAIIRENGLFVLTE